MRTLADGNHDFKIMSGNISFFTRMDHAKVSQNRAGYLETRLIWELTPRRLDLT